MDAPFPAVIRTEDELRSHYQEPTPTSRKKEIDHLDAHCRELLSLAPLLLLASSGPDGRCDVSPRGGPAGFVHVLDDHRLAWGDQPGNRRLDSHANLVANPHAGLLALVPGLGETLRINGRAFLSTDEELRERVAIDRRVPPIVVCVEAQEVYLHCAKALKRSQLWQPDSWPEREAIPSAAAIYRDHVGAGETLEQVEARLAESYTNRIVWPQAS